MLKHLRALLGYNMRRRRKEVAMTQAALAELANSSVTTIVNIEAGHRWPTEDTLYRLARALRMPAGDLFWDPSRKTTAQEAIEALQEAAQLYDSVKLIERTKQDQLTPSPPPVSRKEF